MSCVRTECDTLCCSGDIATCGRAPADGGNLIFDSVWGVLPLSDWDLS